MFDAKGGVANMTIKPMPRKKTYTIIQSMTDLDEYENINKTMNIEHSYT